MKGPEAPKDPEAKRQGFYIMRNKEISATVTPDGRGTSYIYLNDGRLISSAQIVGNLTDEAMLGLLATTQGFRKLVHSIGVSVETGAPKETVRFVLQMYGKTDTYVTGTQLGIEVTGDGMERIIRLDDCDWSEDDDVPGQIRFEMKAAGELARVSVMLYLNDGYEAPPLQEDAPVDYESEAYRRMIERSLVQTGNCLALRRAIAKAKRGEDMTIAFIGGSITQGAGATPIHTQCYAYQTYQGLCRYTGNDGIRYIKAGVGGTSSELGMLRYDRDVLRNGTEQPDIVVVEYAVNDEGDETGGDCYDSLVRRILAAPNHPAVILLFAVFANDWNLQERLSPVGERYRLPMVSIRDCVVWQFYSADRVVSKNQFFYDCYHPTNIGHRIMADALLYLIRTADEQPGMEEMQPIAEVPPVFCAEFESVRLLDRRECGYAHSIQCGDFSQTDTDLQKAEMDAELTPRAQFPDNWMHTGGGEPFRMDIRCSALLMISKDSGSASAGSAVVYVDGKEVLRADPGKVGWTHCHAQICLRGAIRETHHVEVRMQPGDEDKEFTILGFGYVE